MRLFVFMCQQWPLIEWFWNTNVLVFITHGNALRNCDSNEFLLIGGILIVLSMV